MRRTTLSAVALSLAVVGPVNPVAANDDHGSTSPATLEEATLAVGIQVAPKGQSDEPSDGQGDDPAGPNPFVSQLVDTTEIDFAGWRDLLEASSDDRLTERSPARARSMAMTRPPLSAVEEEPTAATGVNDSPATSQRLAVGGLSNRRMAIVDGSLPGPLLDPATGTEQENNGSIPQADRVPIPSVSDSAVFTGRIGNGPNGSDGNGTGDVDFYSIDLDVDDVLLLATDVEAGGLDSVIVVYNAAGEPVAGNDDDPSRPGLASGLSFTPETAGTYSIMVAGFKPEGVLPPNPFDGSAGPGEVGSEGDYSLALGLFEPDVDYYSLVLDRGDVVGVTVDGAGQRVDILDRNEVLRASTALDLSAVYPDESPLPGGGNASAAYVATRPGRHYIAVSGVGLTTALGAYQAEIEIHRSGIAEGDGRPQQNVFIDFDGAVIEPGAFFGLPEEPSALSPMSSFLAGWGLEPADEDAVIDAVMESLKDNLRREVQRTGGNRGAAVSLRNSRDADFDPFGKSNVARVIVGGTIEEIGIATIGQASSIDPGNFDHEDQAFVLLDSLSAPAGSASSLNTYLAADLTQEERIDAIGRSLGNIIAHEVGHLVGNFHTDPGNDVIDLMDMGGSLPNTIGTGRDRVLGTDDDVNVSFGQDVFSPLEGLLQGLENTAGNVAFGLDSEAKRNRIVE